MTLSVVVPVWNEPLGLTRLLLQLRDMCIADQVIVSDDGSDIPCSPELMAEMSRQLGAVVPLSATNPLPGTDLLWLRSEQSLGAGHARNAGAARAEASHILFFDADDSLAPELEGILRMLEGQSYDFAMFLHHDSRMLARGEAGPLEPDASYWADSAIPARPSVMDHAATLQLCRVSAYPWNKIWCREFLEREQIRCTEIPVHNDIEHHWSGFLSANRILATSQVGCIHHVVSGRAQLTNRRDAERLRVFEALNAVSTRFAKCLVDDPHRADFAGPFLDFVLRLLSWIDGRLGEEAAHMALRDLQGRFLRSLSGSSLGVLSLAFECALLRDPDLARRAAPTLQKAA